MTTLHSRLIGSLGSPRQAASRALAGVFLGLSFALLLVGLHEATVVPLALAAVGVLASLTLCNSH